MPNLLRRLWPFGKKDAAPPAKKVAVPRFRKYRQFKFVIDGEEHLIQADYHDQIENQALNETWAKEQAAKLWPKAELRQLEGSRDFAEPI